MSSTTPTLREALADLYVTDKQYEKAFAIYADLRKPSIFEFIEEHNLYDSLKGKEEALINIDLKRAVVLLVRQRKFIPRSDVVSQLLKFGNDKKHKLYLHEYLHALFEIDPNAREEFHGL